MNDQKKIEKRAMDIRGRALAIAYLKRGIQAGIPKELLRIKEESFKKLLFEPYHSDVGGISSFIYKRPDDLSRIPFVLIDGGDYISRKKAAFSIVFRLITRDKNAKCVDCREIEHKFQTIQSSANFNRNEIVDYLKEFDVLFINEFSSFIFKPHFESGDFFDELFSFRRNEKKSTIISFADAIDEKKKFDDRRCGLYLTDFSKRQYVSPNPSEEILRIRVK